MPQMFSDGRCGCCGAYCTTGGCPICTTTLSCSCGFSACGVHAAEIFRKHHDPELKEQIAPMYAGLPYEDQGFAGKKEYGFGGHRGP